MGLQDRAAHVIHKEQGWYVSDSFTDAPTGSWGTKDAYIFERMGDLRTVNQGVPDPVMHTMSRSPRWFTDSGVTVGQWKVGAAAAGLANLDITVEFSEQYSIACFLSAYCEVQMDNTDEIGDALVSLHNEGQWKTNRKWVYTSLKVASGFILMSRQKNVAVTLSGKGTVNASGVPIAINVSGFTTSSSSAAEMVGLENVTPFIKLCEVFDPLGPLTRAVWRQIG